MTATVEQLAQALQETSRLVAQVGGTDWGRPTPCSEWSVRELVAHLQGGNDLFAQVLSHRDPSAVGRSTDYPASVEALLAAFGRPGVLQETFVVPVGPVPGMVALHLRLTEALVHGWDLAVATGQSLSFPDETVEQEIAFSRAKLADLPPDRHPFGPPQPIADGTPPLDRLAALLGRHVDEV